MTCLACFAAGVAVTIVSIAIVVAHKLGVWR
jgi:hypothetical protein